MSALIHMLHSVCGFDEKVSDADCLSNAIHGIVCVEKLTKCH